ncbi:MAG: cytochrome P460 family protein [Bdellovibrionales bacterium]|nr:cytochrome P460 family protein [Bdellovibrionales bacterium]
MSGTNHRYLTIVLLLLGSLGSPVLAQYEGLKENNGYRLEDFKGFPEQWEFITVRYRQDTAEMRFTYANKVAAEALKKGSKDYPDGAVFGKVGRKTEPDPAFASSAVPSGAKRFQFMVRDRKRFKDTDGWGYVLFDQQGKTFPGEPKAAAQACAACHRIVPERGFVFSQFAQLQVKPDAVTKSPTGSFKYEKVAAKTLPEGVKHWLPVDDKEVFSLQGELRRHLFQGTLDEIVPTLTRKLSESGVPALLLSEDGQRFSLVIRDRTSTTCAGKLAVLSVRVAPELNNGLVKKTFCH